MKVLGGLVLVICLAAGRSNAADPPDTANPAIDMDGYLRVSVAAAEHRSRNRVSEEDFLRMSREKGTVVLDARSRQKYDELHIKGAINLPFPDIAIQSLRDLLPDKKARVLIYCNNNFTNAEGPFPSKLPSASLNLATYIALYNYGYRNVYELGPLLDIKTSRLEFESRGERGVAPTGSSSRATSSVKAGRHPLPGGRPASF